MRFLFLTLFLLNLLSLAPTVGTDIPAPRFTITDLGAIPKPDDTLGEIQKMNYAPGAQAMNDRGQVVGGFAHAFLWDDGHTKDLGTLPAMDKSDRQISYASAINNRGQVVGMSGSFLPVSMTYVDQQGFLFSSSALRLLTRRGEFDQLDPSAINERGQVVGYDFRSVRGFFYRNGKLSTLGTLSKLPVGNSSTAQDINDLGQVVGWSTAPGKPGHPLPTHAFLWQRGGKSSRMHDLGTLPGWADSYANGINDRGEVAGSVSNASDHAEDVQPPSPSLAFFWRRGKMVSLGTLPGCRSSEARGLNNSGAIVGNSDAKAFLWQQGRMRDLNALLPAGQGWVLTEARAINNKGQIAGNGLLHGTAHAFLLTPH